MIHAGWRRNMSHVISEIAEKLDEEEASGLRLNQLDRIVARVGELYVDCEVCAEYMERISLTLQRLQLWIQSKGDFSFRRHYSFLKEAVEHLHKEHGLVPKGLCLKTGFFCCLIVAIPFITPGEIIPLAIAILSGSIMGTKLEQRALSQGRVI